MQALVFDAINSWGYGLATIDVLARVRAVKSGTTIKTIHVYVSQINDLLDGTGYRINKYQMEGRTAWVYYLENPRAVGSGPLRRSVLS
jgi:hypothetical protein